MRCVTDKVLSFGEKNKQWSDELRKKASELYRNKLRFLGFEAHCPNDNTLNFLCAFYEDAYSNEININNHEEIKYQRLKLNEFCEQHLQSRELVDIEAFKWLSETPTHQEESLSQKIIQFIRRLLRW